MRVIASVKVGLMDRYPLEAIMLTAHRWKRTSGPVKLRKATAAAEALQLSTSGLGYSVLL